MIVVYDKSLQTTSHATQRTEEELINTYLCCWDKGFENIASLAEQLGYKLHCHMFYAMMDFARKWTDDPDSESFLTDAGLKKMAKKLHPDKGGSNYQFQFIDLLRKCRQKATIENGGYSREETVYELVDGWIKERKQDPNNPIQRAMELLKEKEEKKAKMAATTELMESEKVEPTNTENTTVEAMETEPVERKKKKRTKKRGKRSKKKPPTHTTSRTSTTSTTMTTNELVECLQCRGMRSFINGFCIICRNSKKWQNIESSSRVPKRKQLDNDNNAILKQFCNKLAKIVLTKGYVSSLERWLIGRSFEHFPPPPLANDEFISSLLSAEIPKERINGNQGNVKACINFLDKIIGVEKLQSLFAECM